MNKPKEILELEKVYNITLKEIELSEDVMSWKHDNCYQLDSNSKIVGLNLYNFNFAKILSKEQIKKLEQLTQLQKLKIRLTGIVEIKGLEELTQLQQLDLSHNEITEIKGLDKLIQLQQLDLSWNRIAEIKGLEKLTQLQQLNLSNNQIEAIRPLENIIEVSDKLEVIKIYDNPFSNSLNQLFKEHENNLDAVRKYFSDKKLQQKVFKLPVKVMFLGNHAAGKSTFLHYLQNNELPQKEVESTHILKIESYKLPNEYKQEETVN